jgi:hypothetical protein
LPGVLDAILREYPDDPRVSKSPKQRRDKLTAGYLKFGNWLWRLAAPLGLGIFVLADDELLRIMHVYSSITLFALIKTQTGEKTQGKKRDNKNEKRRNEKITKEKEI